MNFSNNNAPSKKRMTFREEAAKLRPKKVDPIFQGGVCGCPRDRVTVEPVGIVRFPMS